MYCMRLNIACEVNQRGYLLIHFEERVRGGTYTGGRVRDEINRGKENGQRREQM